MRTSFLGATTAAAAIALAIPALAQEGTVSAEEVAMVAEAEEMAEDMMVVEALTEDELEAVRAHLPHLSLSGGINQDIGFGNFVGGEEAAESIHFQTDATLTFTGTGMTDGGLGITAVIELDGDSGGGVKDNRLHISGVFGEIVLGGEDNAAKSLGGTGGGGGYANMGYYDGGDDYTPFSGGAAPIAGTQAQGIRYTLPTIAGVQFGLSFQPDSSTNGGGKHSHDVVFYDKNGDPSKTPFWSAATEIEAAYSDYQDAVASGDKDDIRVAKAALDEAAKHALSTNNATPGSGGDATGADNDNNILAIGANFNADFAGTKFAIGGGWISEDSDDRFGVGSSMTIGTTTLNLRYDSHDDKTTSYGVGVDHVMGSMKFGIGFGTKVQEDALQAPVSGVMLDQTKSSLQIGGQYTMGGGVVLSAGISQGSVENADVDGTDMDDVGVGMRIAFSF